MLPPGELVGVDLKGHVRVGMPQLAAHEQHVESLRDEQARLAMPEAVEGEAPISPDPGRPDSPPERLADLAVVTRLTRRVQEHEVVGTLERCRQPAVPQEPDDRQGEFDLPPTGLGLEGAVLPVARQLAMDPPDAGVEVHLAQTRCTRRLKEPQP